MVREVDLQSKILPDVILKESIKQSFSSAVHLKIPVNSILSDDSPMKNIYSQAAQAAKYSVPYL